MKSLDGEMRKIDSDTVVIADAQRAVGLGGIIGGFESEITATTKNVLLECAWFDPSTIRRTARRLGLKTDASYRFERRVDPNDTLAVITEAARMIVESGGGITEAPVDVIAAEVTPKTIRLRTNKLHEASAGAIGIGSELEYQPATIGVADEHGVLDARALDRLEHVGRVRRNRPGRLP